jgi:hypothetical protein
VCLVPGREEGKIVKGGKDDGRIEFPWFGTTIERLRKERFGWGPPKKTFRAQLNGSGKERPKFSLKRQKCP